MSAPIWIGWPDGETPEVIHEEVDAANPKGAVEYIPQEWHAELIDTLHKVIEHGLPGAMLEGSYEFKLMQERDRY